MNNFDGVIQILSSLHHSSIAKLKSSWEMLPKKTNDLFQEITDLLSNTHHYQKYRTVLRAIPYDTPCIPLMSLISQHMFLIHDNYDDYVEKDWINWMKMEQMGNEIYDVVRFTEYYNYEPVKEIQDYIINSEVWENENTRWAICHFLEDNKESENDSSIYLNTAELNDLLKFNERDLKVLFAGETKLKFKKRKRYFFSWKTSKTIL